MFGALVVSSALALTPSAALSVGPNLVTNGDAETGNLSGWTAINNFGFNWAASGTAHTGSFGFTTGAVGGENYLTQTLPLVVGGQYIVQLWVFNSINSFSVRIGTGSLPLTNVPLISGTSVSGWTFFSATFTATAATETLQIGARNDPSFTSVDDIGVFLQSVFILPLLPTGSSVNQTNVASAIDIASGGILPAGFLTLAGLSGGALQNALDQLSGEPRASFTTAGFQAGNSFLNLLLSPVVQGPGNSFSFRPISGFTTEDTPALPESALAIANVTKAPPRDASVGSSTQRFQLWGSAYGGTASVDGNAAIGSHNTSSQVYGFASGVDYRFAPDAMVGFALAGGGTRWDLDQGLGNGRSDVFQIGVYGTKYSGPAYLSGALGYAWHDVTTNRTVTVSGNDVLSGNFHANWFGGRIEGGYRYAMPAVAVTPYAAAQVQTINMPSYAENATSGSSQFALTYASQTTTTTRTELGASFDKNYALNNGASLLVFSRAAWAHDFNNNYANATALFQSLPGSSFVVNGATPAADSALVTAGAEYKLTNGWSIFGKFVGQFSSNTSLYAGTATLRYAW